MFVTVILSVAQHINNTNEFFLSFEILAALMSFKKKV